jgi:DNA primase
MAGRIPQHFIDELIARTDIVEVVDARVPLKRRGKEYLACCPFHSEKTPSFTVSQDKQFYHCFGCGAHGTAIGFLMEYEGLDFVEAIEALAQQLGLEVPREGGAPRPRVDDDLEQTLQAAADYYKAQLRRHPEAVEYLKGRGLSGEIAAEYGLGYAPDSWDGLLRQLGGPARGEALARAGLVIERDTGGYYDRFRGRIMFPIRDRRGRVIAFGGRVIGAGEPKYLNSPETPLFHKGRELYGLYESRKSGGRLERLILVEGYMDVIALAQAGITNAVATLGTATTPEHLQRLFRAAPEVVFCFDGDRAGRQAAWKALETALPVLRDGLEASFLFLPEGEDPDSLVRSLGADGFRARLEQATGIAEFLIAQLVAQFNIETKAGRARLGEQARKLLGDLSEGLLRDQIVQELARITDISAERLDARLRGTEPAQPPAARPRRIDDHRVQVTPMRLAIALLLNRPALGPELGAQDWLTDLDQPGAPLLADILETCLENPNLPPAGLLERWRGTEHEPHLAGLLEWQPPNVDDATLTSMLQDAVHRLRLKHDEQRTENLLRKARTSPLGPAEKAELQALLGRRGPAQP